MIVPDSAVEGKDGATATLQLLFFLNERQILSASYNHTEYLKFPTGQKLCSYHRHSTHSMCNAHYVQATHYVNVCTRAMQVWRSRTLKR
jgi:hypothetical protein